MGGRSNLGMGGGRSRDDERGARERARLQEQIVGRTVEGMALKREVLRRESLERRLRAVNAHLERVNAELDSFAYAISHDLIAPLRKCKTLLGFMVEDQKPALNEGAMEHYKAAVGMTDQMTAMIQGVLEYSRARESVSAEPVALGSVVKEALANVETSTVECGAVVTVGDLPTVSGSHVRLLQLFQNLLQNAVRYRSDRQLKIDISAAEIKGCWRISVEDNGSGIEGRSIEDAFILFRKAHTGSTGLGIGLALCKQIVEAHGGKIEVESKVDQGSTFHVTLPLFDLPEPTDPPERPDQPT